MDILIETQKLATQDGQLLYLKDRRGNIIGMLRTDRTIFPCLKPTPRYTYAKMRPKSYAEQFGPFPQPTSVTATPEPQITQKHGRSRKQSVEQPVAKQVKSNREAEIVEQIKQDKLLAEQLQRQLQYDFRSHQNRVSIKV